jgi:hypothetical protein
LSAIGTFNEALHEAAQLGISIKRQKAAP